jgi:modification methylase
MATMADKRAAPRVAFGLLVESGLCQPGTELTDSRQRYSARVRADGSIESGGHSGSIHKGGAALPGAPSCKGWTFWHGKEVGQLQPLDALRQRHLAAL